ncbi:unnamed protein product, partial [Symbiodinium necroappetens]
PVFASFRNRESVLGPGRSSSCGGRVGAPSSISGGRRGGGFGQPRLESSEISCAAASGRLSPGAREARHAGATAGTTHAIQRSGRRADGLLESGAVGSSNDTAGTASRASRSISTIPAYVDYAVPGSCGAPGSDGISASCGTPDTDDAKAGSHDGQMDRSGHTGSHRGAEASSHRGTEGGFHRGASSSGSYDGTAALSDHGAAAFPKDGATVCYSHGAKALDVDDSSGTAR